MTDALNAAVNKFSRKNGFLNVLAKFDAERDLSNRRLYKECNEYSVRDGARCAICILPVDHHKIPFRPANTFKPRPAPWSPIRPMRSLPKTNLKRMLTTATTGERGAIWPKMQENREREARVRSLMTGHDVFTTGDRCSPDYLPRRLQKCQWKFTRTLSEYQKFKKAKLNYKATNDGVIVPSRRFVVPTITIRTEEVKQKPKIPKPSALQSRCLYEMVQEMGYTIEQLNNLLETISINPRRTLKGGIARQRVADTVTYAYGRLRHIWDSKYGISDPDVDWSIYANCSPSLQLVLMGPPKPPKMTTNQQMANIFDKTYNTHMETDQDGLEQQFQVLGKTISLAAAKMALMHPLMITNSPSNQHLHKKFKRASGTIDPANKEAPVVPGFTAKKTGDDKATKPALNLQLPA